MDDLIEALQIFKKYTDKQDIISCEDSVLIIKIEPYEVSYTDCRTLEKLGFSANHDKNNFISYQYSY